MKAKGFSDYISRKKGRKLRSIWKISEKQQNIVLWVQTMEALVHYNISKRLENNFMKEEKFQFIQSR